MFVTDLLENADKKYGPIDPEILRELQRLPQPITVNGGSYSYTADINANPLKWKTSDGGTLKVRSLREISEWFDRWAAEEWNRYLSGEEYLEYMVSMNIISYPNGRMKPPKNQEEHELANQFGVKRKKGLDFKKLTTKPDQLLKYNDNLDEVAMNPTSFGQAITQGHDEKVKIGFEFEVCVPKETIRSVGKNPQATVAPMTPEEELEYTMSKIPRNWHKTYSLRPGSWGYLCDRFKLSQPITFNGRTTNSLSTLIKFYKRPIAKKAIEKLVGPTSTMFTPARKRAVIARCQHADPIEYLKQIRSYLHNGRSWDGWQEVARMADRYNEKINDVSKFLMEAFASNNAVDVFPKFKLDLKKIREDFDIYLPNEIEDDDDDEFYDSDYSNAVKVLRPVLEKNFGKVEVFSDYHQRAKLLDRWYIEPDGSIYPDHSGDGNAEVVTPPLYVNEAMSALKTFYAIAKQYKLYTNGSTGLHINVSIPKTLDVLKLAVFLGDPYVLKTFNREDNEYAQSVMHELTHRSGDVRDRGDLELFNKNPQKYFDRLERLAKSISSDHMSSISYNGKYVSFRHAGGDYLNKYDTILNIVGRFVRAMIIASNPNMYRQEYLTKLVKLFKPEAPKTDLTFMDLSPIINSPVNVLLMGICPTRTNTSVINLAKRAKDDYAGEVGTFVTMNDTATIRQLLAKGTANRQVKPETKTTINANINKCLVGIVINPPSYLKNRYKDVSAKAIYTGSWNESRMGIILLQSTTLTPGTPIHKLAITALMNIIKEKRKEKIAQIRAQQQQARGRRGRR